MAGVFDDKCRLITGLAKDDFRGMLGRRPVEILDVAYDQGPRRIVLLLDAGWKTAGADPRRKTMRGVAEDTIRPSSAKFSFAGLAFPPKAQFQLGFETSRETKIKSLDGFLSTTNSIRERYNKTALFEAIMAVLQEFQSLQPGDATYDTRAVRLQR